MVGVLLFVIGAQLVPQQAADPELRAAIAAYDALEFKDAVPLLHRALGRTELAPADRRAALAYLGRVEAVLQREEAAVDAFSRLLVIDPTFAVAEIESPLIRAAFAKAKARYDAVSSAGAVGTNTGADRTGGTVETTTEPLPLESLEPQPWYERPVWLVALGGAALLLTTVLIVSSGDDAPPREPALPTGTLGRWELP